MVVRVYDDPSLKKFIQLQNCLVGYPDFVPGVLPSLETNKTVQTIIVLGNNEAGRALLHNIVAKAFASDELNVEYQE